jgi:hypothetical protein
MDLASLLEQSPIAAVMLFSVAFLIRVIVKAVKDLKVPTVKTEKNKNEESGHRCSAHEPMSNTVTETHVLVEGISKQLDSFVGRTDKYFDESFDRLRDLEKQCSNHSGRIKILEHERAA